VHSINVICLRYLIGNILHKGDNKNNNNNNEDYNILGLRACKLIYIYVVLTFRTNFCLVPQVITRQLNVEASSFSWHFGSLYQSKRPQEEGHVFYEVFGSMVKFRNYQYLQITATETRDITVGKPLSTNCQKYFWCLHIQNKRLSPKCWVRRLTEETLPTQRSILAGEAVAGSDVSHFRRRLLFEYEIEPFKTKVDTLCNRTAVVNFCPQREIVGIN
jgi:hypothetical protein